MMQVIESLLDRYGHRALPGKAKALLEGHPGYMLAPLTCREVCVLRTVCGPIRIARVAILTTPWLVVGMALIYVNAPSAVLVATCITALAAIQAWEAPALRPRDLQPSDNDFDLKLLELTPRGRVLISALKAMGRGPCLIELVWSTATD